MSSSSTSLTTPYEGQVPHKYLALAMKWDEMCLPLGLRFEYNLRNVRLTKTKDLTDFIKFLLGVCEDPSKLGVTKREGLEVKKQRVALSEIMFWTIVVYGGKFLCMYTHFFRTFLLKFVELREYVKTRPELEDSFLTTGTQILLFYKTYGSKVLKPYFYVSCLSILHASLCKEPMSSCLLEKLKILRQLEYEHDRPPPSWSSDMKNNLNEPSLDNNIPSDDSSGTLDNTLSKDDQNDEVVEKVSSKSWLSWIW